jgi:hypothetical protein
MRLLAIRFLIMTASLGYPPLVVYSAPSRAIDTVELQCLVSKQIAIPEVYVFLNRDPDQKSGLPQAKEIAIRECLKDELKDSQ